MEPVERVINVSHFELLLAAPDHDATLIRDTDGAILVVPADVADETDGHDILLSKWQLELMLKDTDVAKSHPHLSPMERVLYAFRNRDLPIPVREMVIELTNDYRAEMLDEDVDVEEVSILRGGRAATFIWKDAYGRQFSLTLASED